MQSQRRVLVFEKGCTSGGNLDTCPFRHDNIHIIPSHSIPVNAYIYVPQSIKKEMMKRMITSYVWYLRNKSKQAWKKRIDYPHRPPALSIRAVSSLVVWKHGNRLRKRLCVPSFSSWTLEYRTHPAHPWLYRAPGGFTFKKTINQFFAAWWFQVVRVRVRVRVRVGGSKWWGCSPLHHSFSLSVGRWCHASRHHAIRAHDLDQTTRIRRKLRIPAGLNRGSSQ